MEDNSFTSSSKIRLLKKLLLLLVIVVAADFFIGFGLKKLFFSQTGGADFKTHYAIEHVNSELVIFGSSRAYRHYNPLIIQEKTGLNTFNVGRFGQSIFYNVAILRLMLKRHQPKVILLDIDPNELLYNETHYVRTSCLLPYYRNHQEIREIINDVRGKNEMVKNLSSIYPYNSTAIFSIRNIYTDDDPDFLVNKGFKPYQKVLDQESYETQLSSTMKFDRLSKMQIDPKKVEYLEQFIQEARNQGIIVYVGISPMLYQIPNENSYAKIQETCAQLNVPLLDYYKASAFNGYGNYYDLNHLSKESANRFSHLVADELAALMENINKPI